MAMNTAQTYLVLLVQHLAVSKARLRLATEAQAQDSRVPAEWKIDGDGRGRGGQEDIWPINDITLTVKVRWIIAGYRALADDQGGLWVQMEAI
jgi:hypothetical protein